MKRIGIFAGTFDPVHAGHLAFAKAGLEAGLDKVFFLVEPRPWRKQGVRALEHRQAMVDLAIADESGFGMVVLERARLTPHETLPILQRRFKGHKLVLLFGDDVISYMVNHIADWPHIEELAASSELMIAARNHKQLELREKLQILKRDHDLPFDYRFVDPGQQATSASKIRTALAAELHPKGLPKNVASYIKTHGLYTNNS